MNRHLVIANIVLLLSSPLASFAQDSDQNSSKGGMSELRRSDRGGGDGRGHRDGGSRNRGRDRNRGPGRDHRDGRDPRGGGGHDGEHRGGRHRHPIRFNPGPMPRGGWRGDRFYWNGLYYTVWNWGPYSPWSNWPDYYGWKLGLGYYFPEGIKCFADNTEVAGEWIGNTPDYFSDDAIQSALDACKSDPRVKESGFTETCRIRTCVRW